jgi:uncharacterized protein (TIGR03067 family)
MTRVLLPIVLVAVLVQGIALAQDALTAPIQGRWLVTSGEHGGKPMATIAGGVMTIAGSAFEIRTSSGNLLTGTLRLDTSTRPFKMDLLHADGGAWEAIYETAADTLRLNYVEKGGPDPRPTTFATAEKTEESLISLRRESAAR